MDVTEVLVKNSPSKKYIVKDTPEITTFEAVESQSLKRKRRNNSGKRPILVVEY